MNETKIKILYAEDDRSGAKLTKLILEKENFQVMIAPDGAEAWKIYKEWKPDIILTDLDMGENSGLKLTQNIRKHDRQTHIIVYTTHGEPANEIAVLNAGADTFICKERPEVLISYMNRVKEKIKTCMNIPYLHTLSSHTTYNSVTRELTIDGKNVQLKGIEGRFLHLLCAKNHEVASKPYLVQGIWDKSDRSKESELKKYASLLRGYLKADPTLQIECRHGGYILLSLAE